MGKRGKPVGWRSPKNANRDRSIVAYHADGVMSLAQVADAFGLTKQRVHQIICEGRRKSLDDAAAVD